MGLIDLILNIAGVLLWLSWRSIRLDALTRATPATLAGTLRRAEPSRVRRWHFLFAIAALVVIRALFYWQIGPATEWTPKLDLAVISLAFRANSFQHELVFSTLSLLRALLVFYFWLLTLAIIHRNELNPNSFQKMLFLHLGRVARWPVVVQAIVPFLAVAISWLIFYPLLAHLGVINWAQSKAHVFEQSCLVGLGIYLTLKYLLPVFLFLHLITSYVFLGAGPFWDFITSTSRTILKPLRPLRFGKIDFAPVIGIVLIALLLHTAPEFLRATLMKSNVTLWPH
ncbi:MAG TPA: hypothetical protein VFM25_05410 [Verrucomicrobiae bacterium]|nr:hypothetical protein [Verrucomicrobiae bacterium]